MKDASRVEFILFALLYILNAELADRPETASYFIQALSFLNQSVDAFVEVFSGVPTTP
jgi:hypothetical protein